MKVVKKQKNSKMCFVCGLDNQMGLQAPFYEMEDKSVYSLFKFREEHQSFPGRVHGGVITSMIDEIGLRALWPYEPDVWGVTLDLDIKYRKPTPYNELLKAQGIITKNTSRAIESEITIYDMDNNVLVTGHVKYLKMTVDKINSNVVACEEMCYDIDDGVTDID